MTQILDTAVIAAARNALRVLYDVAADPKVQITVRRKAARALQFRGLPLPPDLAELCWSRLISYAELVKLAEGLSPEK